MKKIETNCPYCHHNHADQFRARQQTDDPADTRDFMLCQECGTIYPQPRLLFSDLPQAEPCALDIDVTEMAYSGFLNRPNDELHAFIKTNVNDRTGKALEIGCSIGAQLAVLEKAGLDAFGIDPDPQAVAFALSKGHKVFKGFFPDDIPDEITSKRYSLIMALECLYYFVDLKQALATIHTLLDTDGVLILKCHQGKSHCYHNAAISMFSRFGRTVQGIPTRDSLIYCLQHSGFEIATFQVCPRAAWEPWFGIDLHSKWPFLQKVLNQLTPPALFSAEQADRYMIVARKTD